MSVILELSERQADTVRAALDLYTRLHLGQVEELGRLERPNGQAPRDWEAHDRFREFCSTLGSEMTGLGRGINYSIHAKEVPNTAKRAFDIMRVLRQTMTLGLKRPTHPLDVALDTIHPLLTEPLPTCRVQ